MFIKELIIKPRMLNFDADKTLLENNDNTWSSNFNLF